MNESRPMLASVENTVTSSMQTCSIHEETYKSTPSRQGSQSSNSSIKSSISSSNGVNQKSPPSHDHHSVEPVSFPTGQSSSNNTHPYSESIMVAASSSHSNLTASLLTPTLASALGIIPSSRRKKSQKQNTTPVPSSSSASASASASASSAVAGSSKWPRRPSLPALASGDSRMSMYSVASFESLPEGESVSHISSSPYSKPSNDLLDPTSYGSSPKLESSMAGMRKNKDPSRRFHVRINDRPLRSAEDGNWTKRRNVAKELLDTERAFVASLRIVNDHYYQPLLGYSKGVSTSSTGTKLPDNAAPNLSKKAINEIFSNFADILHLNSELLIRLDDRLSGRNRDPPNSRPVSMVIPGSVEESIEPNPEQLQKKTDANTHPWDPKSDLIGDLLAPMAPFLKMYSFFVKNFSSALTRIEAERKTNEVFARFLKETERLTWMTSASTEGADGVPTRSGGFGFGLGLQAHLLSIVQRIPRYKLLVGELVKCTPVGHKDYSDLCRAYQVIEQVAESINDNIRQHEMVLSMLSIQRTLIGMNEPLITPGRALLKRATLRKAGRKDIHAREFFLFTDCIIYAAPIGGAIADASAAWQAFSRYGVVEGTSSPLGSPTMAKSPYQQRNLASSPGKPFEVPIRRRTTSVPTQVESNRLSFSSLEGQQLQFRGKFALQDCTVVGVESANSNDLSLRHCIEIRTPGKSFAIYADSTEAKAEWLTAMRNAREELMTNRRTLQAEEDSISAKRERRRSLQAINRKVSFPQIPDSSSSIPEGSSVEAFTEARPKRESLPSFSTTGSLAAYLTGSSANSASMANSNLSASRNGGLKVLEDYNAPVWVPDSRADKCACCSESFGLWRRKHHCRLCGQVVCWSCSQKTFLIASYEDGEQDRPARACDTCYESVFPETPEPSLVDVESAAASTPATNVEQCIHASRALDSDASLPSCPPTPTSPQEMCIITTHEDDDTMHSLTPGVDSPRVTVEQSENTTANRRNRSVSPPTRENRSNQPISPAARVAKAHALEAQLFHGKLLSPQVHAATSGSGTFRLVTPRLTTPEWERPPLLRSSKTYGGEINMTSSNETSSQATPASTSINQSHPNECGDYFAGVSFGADQLHLENNEVDQVKTSLLQAPVRRRKPLSAAARLSSFYGALPQISTPNSSSPSPAVPSDS
ncbi:uncharacterized protein FA14DRAFT_41472 [Meira miltonrushii]|uniref:Uncharacterized protein n=1 Tax=Meira miltonrushii TaxID=1280837 RepID=A0A316VEC8_9BASI|nr:uncharacterized protein FA14DRAFT_41472 [Meira miltonrushii]PWN35428.1 hypothetical protein FA14DRAFT_41472 [Meira miltonrushii]